MLRIDYKFLFKFVTLGLMFITASAAGIYGADRVLVQDVKFAEANGQYSPLPIPIPTLTPDPSATPIPTMTPAPLPTEMPTPTPIPTQTPYLQPTSYPVYKVYTAHEVTRWNHYNQPIPQPYPLQPSPSHTTEPRHQNPQLQTSCPGGWVKQTMGVATVCVPQNQQNQEQNQNNNQTNHQNNNQNNNQNQNVNTNVLVSGGNSSSSSSSSSSNSVNINFDRH